MAYNAIKIDLANENKIIINKYLLKVDQCNEILYLPRMVREAVSGARLLRLLPDNQDSSRDNLLTPW